MHADDPTLSRAEMARRLGVTRERVGQIVREEGLTLQDARYGARPNEVTALPHTVVPYVRS